MVLFSRPPHEHSTSPSPHPPWLQEARANGLARSILSDSDVSGPDRSDETLRKAEEWRLTIFTRSAKLSGGATGALTLSGNFPRQSHQKVCQRIGRVQSDFGTLP
ncbi:hypothetical protein JZ751_020973 [Albula glossodonta]|uniref:Uncharacterized protein n=1 Tax=Albula glossodonta TaxID=121402 RepID=A0A8T2PJW0_9TELE|nr:hypothetical protein JZ751_020973 [Albula glossodonta]